MKQLILQSTATKQSVVDYVNAANQVCRYALSIDTIVLPALVYSPENYGQYAETLAKAKVNVMKWMQEIIPTFQMLPTALLSISNLVQPQLTIIKTNLQTLQQNPDDAAAKTAITNAVNAVVQGIPTSRNVLVALDGWISTYQGTITPDAQTLSHLSTLIATAVNADQTQIDKLHTVNDTLQSVINDRSELATLNTVSNVALTIFLAVFGAAVGLPFSPVAGAVIGGVVGISTGVITQFLPIHNDPDYQQTQKEIQDQMDYVTKEIGLLQSTVGLLQIVSKQFDQLLANSGQASAQIQVVLNSWKQLENDVKQLVTDLNDILTNVQSGTIDKALADIKDAQDSWTDLLTFAMAIKGVTYEVDTSNVPPMPPTS